MNRTLIILVNCVVATLVHGFFRNVVIQLTCLKERGQQKLSTHFFFAGLLFILVIKLILTLDHALDIWRSLCSHLM